MNSHMTSSTSRKCIKHSLHYLINHCSVKSPHPTSQTLNPNYNNQLTPQPSPSTHSIPFLHKRQTRLINPLITRILNNPPKHPLINHPRRLEVSHNEKVRIARPRTQHKRPIGLARLHQLADSARVIAHRIPRLLLLIRIEQVLERMPERCLARASEVFLRAW